jgi:hypothetical protein
MTFHQQKSQAKIHSMAHTAMNDFCSSFLPDMKPKTIFFPLPGTAHGQKTYSERCMEKCVHEIRSRTIGAVSKKFIRQSYFMPSLVGYRSFTQIRQLAMRHSLQINLRSVLDRPDRCEVVDSLNEEPVLVLSESHRGDMEIHHGESSRVSDNVHRACQKNQFSSNGC